MWWKEKDVYVVFVIFFCSFFLFLSLLLFVLHLFMFFFSSFLFFFKFCYSSLIFSWFTNGFLRVFCMYMLYVFQYELRWLLLLLLLVEFGLVFLHDKQHCSCQYANRHKLALLAYLQWCDRSEHWSFGTTKI